MRLADRALTSTNPLLAWPASLLELAGGRVTATEVLDLAAAEPCRRRFGFTDDDLDRISRWVAGAGVRWGLDAEHAQRFAMERFAHNTWRAGLDRILLGVAMSGDDHRHLGRGLPLDDVGSNDIDLAGRLAELLDRLDDCLTALARRPRSRSGWTRCATASATSPTSAPTTPGRCRSSSASWPGPRPRRRPVGPSCGWPTSARCSQSRLAGRPTRANFRTGTLTVCTMVPMRSVPHRVVCLVGLDDGVFPRAGTVDGDDVLGRRPLTGERDARSEDRQLLLDAVLAATETLVITYTGANEHSGAAPAPRRTPRRARSTPPTAPPRRRCASAS